LLRESAAEILREEFPTGRPSDTVGELRTMVARKLGRKDISSKTIQRAMRDLAWAAEEPK
jgi:hypothetical protein